MMKEILVKINNIKFKLVQKTDYIKKTLIQIFKKKKIVSQF